MSEKENADIFDAEIQLKVDDAQPEQMETPIEGQESSFIRQHPVAAITKSVRLIRSNILTILILLFLGRQGEDAFMLPFMGASVLLLLVVGVLDWLRFTYQVLPGELHVRRGVLVRKELILPKERIQVVEIREGFIERWFGLVRLEIQTASVNDRVTLTSVTRAEAVRINGLLTGELVEPAFEGSSTQKKGSSDAVNDLTTAAHLSQGAATAYQEKSPRFRLPSKELLIAAATSGGFGVTLSILGTLYTQVQTVVGDSVIFDWIESTLPGLEGGVWAVMFVLFLLVSWTLSFIGFLLTNSGFEIQDTGKELVLRRGMFERNRTTLPLERIQAVRLVQGVLRQPLGRGTLIVESAGFGDEHGSGSTSLIPLLRISEAPEMLTRFLSRFRFAEVSITTPRTAKFRYILRSLALPVVASILVLSFTVPGLLDDVAKEMLMEQGIVDAQWERDISQAGPNDPKSMSLSALREGVTGEIQKLIYAFETRTAPWLALLTIVFLLTGFSLLGRARHRQAGMGVEGEALLMRNRRFALETSLLLSSRVQSLTLSQTWLQKRKGLASVTVRVASGRQGRQFKLRDILLEDAKHIQEWYRAR